MLSRLVVKNYQSLREVDLPLKGFTIVVGASSSGKSALVRAIGTLLHNTRGNTFISHGQRECVLTAHTDTGIVTLTRSKSTTDTSNAYTVRTDAGQQRYTKLAGSTPAEVTKFFGAAADPIAVAGQFDSPFLLSASAAEAARTLAGLTNVDRILEAARESNRRKLDAARELATAVADAEAVSGQLAAFTGHDAADAALTRAEALLESVTVIAGKIDALTEAVIRIERAKVQAAPLHAKATTVVPSLAAHTETLGRIRNLSRAIATVQQGLEARASQQVLILQLQSELATLDTQQHDALHEAGICPTCKQAIR